MIWAILISSILLLTLNLLYILLKKRTDAREALNRLALPLKRREMLLRRLPNFAKTGVPETAVADKLQQALSAKEYEQLIAQENEILPTIDRIESDLDSEIAEAFSSEEAETIKASWYDFRRDWHFAALEYNLRAKAYNELLRDFPGRLLAGVLKMRLMPSLKV